MKKQKIAIIIDPWRRNILSRIFFWRADQYLLFRRIRKFLLENSDELETVIVASYDNFPVDDMIANLPIHKVYTTDIDLVLFIIKEKNITGIYLCGSAWDECVEKRSLGYLNLHKNTNLNIFVKNDCVIYSEKYKSKIFDPADNPDWVETHEQGIFKYGPK